MIDMEWLDSQRAVTLHERRIKRWTRLCDWRELDCLDRNPPRGQEIGQFDESKRGELKRT